MYLKIYKNGEHILVAACDKEVLGKSLKHGNSCSGDQQGLL